LERRYGVFEGWICKRLDDSVFHEAWEYGLWNDVVPIVEAKMPSMADRTLGFEGALAYVGRPPRGSAQPDIAWMGGNSGAEMESLGIGKMFRI